jgi:hypothetical protein
MHDWYILGTLVDALSSSMIGTWFMVDMTYMYGNTYLLWFILFRFGAWLVHLLWYIIYVMIFEMLG